MGYLGLLPIIDMIDSQWSLKPWIKAKTASGESLVYRVGRIVSFGDPSPDLELGVYLGLFRDSSVANSDIPSMS